MNQFKYLDTLFPCGEDRLSGEVVTTEITFHYSDYAGVFKTPLRLSWKRKAVYVNASVNAFHMHRGLCREFDDKKSLIPGLILTTRNLRLIKHLIASAVENSYLVNYETGGQFCRYSALMVADPAFPHVTSLSLWWDVGCNQTEWREIVSHGLPLGRNHYDVLGDL